MRQNGLGTLSLDEARTWIEETGLCLFLPKRQFSSSVAPSFVEAVTGQPESTPDQKAIAFAEDLLVRLENEGVAVRLNLIGQPGEQPDFVVAAWVLPYVYALRGDRDWRRSPQLTGSRQVSQLAVHVYKHLEGGDLNVSQLKQALGREVTESAVIRAITELWQQLRIIPTIAARGQAAKWQLLRTRFQRAIAEGASTSQVTAISVLASIYLQAVIAASMEDVELFLAPLTARSKIREVIRGLVATRQVHTISLGHAPHFYVAGTLPEFEPASTTYASSSMPASAYFMRSFDDDAPKPAVSVLPQQPVFSQPPAPAPVRVEQPVAADYNGSRTLEHRPSGNGPSESNRPASNGHDRKPAQPTRPTTASPNGHGPRHASDAHKRRTQNGSRTTASPRWNAAKTVNGKRTSSGNGSSHAPSSSRNGKHTANGNGSSRSVNGSRSGKLNSSSHASNGSRTAKPTRVSSTNGSHRSGKPSAPAWSKRAAGAKAKPAASRKAQARKSRPSLTAVGRASAGGKRFFKNRSKQGTKKRG
jgi:23S rRNA pseudouridine2605 synthase